MRHHLSDNTQKNDIMEHYQSITNMLWNIAQFAGRLLHSGDYVTLRAIKDDLKKLTERYQDE